MPRPICAALPLAMVLIQASTAVTAQAGTEPVYDPATRTYTLAEPPDARWPAPDVPIVYRAAYLHWDGRGELLLAPDRGVGSDAEFGIGATFDGSDATADDRSADGTDRRCPVMEGTYYIRNGHFGVSQGAFPAGPQSVRVTSDPRQPGLFFATERCRYRIVLSTKLRGGGRWVDAPVADPPSSPKPPTGSGKAIRLEAGQSFIIRMASYPQELSSWRATSGTGVRLAEGIADGCPEPSGVVDLRPGGVFLTQQWPSNRAYAPGFSRDVEARATTLIFQSSTCREEIRVSRDVKVNGAWRASLLSVAPTGAEVHESRRGVQD